MNKETQAAESWVDRAYRLRDGLIAEATGHSFEGGDDVYCPLRDEFLTRADLKIKLPAFVRRYRTLSAFWQFIKHESSTYKERAAFIRREFEDLTQYLEDQDDNPGSQPVEESLFLLDSSSVMTAWEKAIERCQHDPEGAITAARSLLETVCKHILDHSDQEYEDSVKLPRLWALCSEELRLAPQQHQEEVFKKILGSCQAVVNNLAEIRNQIGDAHGRGRRQVKPQARHARLVVNLAGTMAAFLVATWVERNPGDRIES